MLEKTWANNSPKLWPIYDRASAEDAEREYGGTERAMRRQPQTSATREGTTLGNQLKVLRRTDVASRRKQTEGGRA